MVLSSDGGIATYVVKTGMAKHRSRIGRCEPRVGRVWSGSKKVSGRRLERRVRAFAAICEEDFYSTDMQ